MRILVAYGIILFLCFSCKAQERMTLRYVGQNYKETKNKSFINNELKFIRNGDTLRFSIKVPYDASKRQFINEGIFYNCHLKKETIYDITLKKICVTDIPEAFYSYYKTNTIMNEIDCSKFTEVEKDTEYKYLGKYGKYLDIEGVLYEVIGLSPDNGCVFPH
ncbi:hypothetical protein SAMN05421741_1249 [Paenimyroides ummariense]|uniref:Uncharacterized protein n=1 Tax=Paenimyroides ummariense TaxID=913024 RepID=A0A1I5F176_9FLAO|nr:hypothetical protein [Paenimyroides ummariense]SFO17548.1 hypothetical protein SAMN05421741_1249 [Paenimyroides ummariense]